MESFLTESVTHKTDIFKMMWSINKNNLNGVKTSGFFHTNIQTRGFFFLHRFEFFLFYFIFLKKTLVRSFAQTNVFSFSLKIQVRNSD